MAAVLVLLATAVQHRPQRVVGLNTQMTLPPGTWHGSQNAPGSGRALTIREGSVATVETGAYVWHAGKVLCGELGEKHASQIAGSSVLELGAGTGTVGIFAAGLGAARVLLTDGGSDGVLEQCRLNVEDNRDAYPEAVIDVLEFQWGDELPPAIGGAWDWVFGSDLTYGHGRHEPLCSTLRSLLLPDDEEGLLAMLSKAPRVLLSHQHRLGEPPLDAFYACAASHGLTVEEVGRVERPPDGEYEPCSVSLLEVWKV